MESLIGVNCSAIECSSTGAPIWRDILAQAMTGELLAAMNYTSLSEMCEDPTEIADALEHAQGEQGHAAAFAAEGRNVGEQMVSERLVQEAHPTQTSKYRQHAQNSRQEGRPDNEVAGQERIESEKYQGDRRAMVIHLKKEERQRLQLFRAEYAQVVRASQDEQGGDKKEPAKGFDDATCEA